MYKSVGICRLAALGLYAATRTARKEPVRRAKADVGQPLARVRSPSCEGHLLFGDSAMLSQMFQPSGRFWAANSEYPFRFT